MVSQVSESSTVCLLANAQVGFDWPSGASKYTKIFQHSSYLSNFTSTDRNMMSQN